MTLQSRIQRILSSNAHNPLYYKWTLIYISLIVTAILVLIILGIG